VFVASIRPKASRAIVRFRGGSRRAVAVVDGVVVVGVVVEPQFPIADHNVNVGNQGCRAVREIRPGRADRHAHDRVVDHRSPEVAGLDATRDRTAREERRDRALRVVRYPDRVLERHAGHGRFVDHLEPRTARFVVDYQLLQIALRCSQQFCVYTCLQFDGPAAQRFFGACCARNGFRTIDFSDNDRFGF